MHANGRLLNVLSLYQNILRDNDVSSSSDCCSFRLSRRRVDSHIHSGEAISSNSFFKLIVIKMVTKHLLIDNLSLCVWPSLVYANFPHTHCMKLSSAWLKQRGWTFQTNFTNISKPRILTIPFTVAVASDIFVSGHILLNGILSTDCYLDKKRDLRNISDLHIFALIKWPSPMATHLGDVVSIVSRGEVGGF